MPWPARQLEMNFRDAAGQLKKFMPALLEELRETPHMLPRCSLQMHSSIMKKVTGGAADIYNFFDQLLRPLIYEISDKAGMPKGV